EGSAVECYAALGRPVEPEHELRERALAGAGPADEGDLRAHRARDAHIADRRPGGLPIPERHAVEADLSPEPDAPGFRRGLLLPALVEHVLEPGQVDADGLDLQGVAGQHVDG